MAGIKRPLDDELPYSLGDNTPTKRRRSSPPQSSATTLERRLHQNAPGPLEWAWNHIGETFRGLFVTPQALPLIERSPAKPLLLGYQTSFSRKNPAAGTIVGGGSVISHLPGQSNSNGTSYLGARTGEGAIDLTGDNDVDDEVPERSFSPLPDTRHTGSSSQHSHRRGIMAESKRANRPRAWENQTGGGPEEEVEREPRRPTHRAPRYNRQEKQTLRGLEESLARARLEAEMGVSEELRERAERDVKAFSRTIEEMKKTTEEAKDFVMSTQPPSLSQYHTIWSRLNGRSPWAPTTAPPPEVAVLRATHSRPVPERYVKPKDIEGLMANMELKQKEEDEKYRKPSVPKSLAPDQIQLVNATLSNPRFKTPKNGGEMIESHNMKRLKDGQWLSDDIMAYYIMLINARNAADPTLPDIHCFNTFFYSKIDKDPTSHATVRRWTKKVDIFAKDLVLVPINIGNMHWVGAVINFKRKRIEYFDSMGVGHGAEQVYENLREYIEAEHQDKKGSNYDMSDWKYVSKADAPRQDNGSDCGIFSCQTLELVARGADPIDKGFEFKAANMSFFRKLMVYEITKGELMKRW